MIIVVAVVAIGTQRTSNDGRIEWDDQRVYTRQILIANRQAFQLTIAFDCIGIWMVKLVNIASDSVNIIAREIVNVHSHTRIIFDVEKEEDEHFERVSWWMWEAGGLKKDKDQYH